MDVEEIKQDKIESSRPTIVSNTNSPQVAVGGSRPNSAKRDLRPNFDQIRVSLNNSKIAPINQKSPETPNIFNLSGVSPVHSPQPKKRDIVTTQRVTSAEILNSFSKPEVGENIASNLKQKGRPSSIMSKKSNTSNTKKPLFKITTNIKVNQPKNFYEESASKSKIQPNFTNKIVT